MVQTILMRQSKQTTIKIKALINQNLKKIILKKNYNKMLNLKIKKIQQ